MQTTSIRLITVSREFGAGGSELAGDLASRLGWPVLDHDIVHRVAERLRLDDGTVEAFDEHTPSLLARIATVLIVPQPYMYSVPVEDAPSHDAIAEATRRVITEAAASLPVIVVGHGAQCIFADRSDAMHIRVVAPLNARLQRIATRMNLDPSAAAALVRRADEDRQSYVQRYFHRDWRNPLLYDLQVNTGRVGVADAGAMVAEFVGRSVGHEHV
ncbi:MAG: Cytidylate kinaselike family [Gemmatimonadetes bacterium]|nr:Cytidylate kinaselike family [Gemmatimonadota bacterium]